MCGPKARGSWFAVRERPAAGLPGGLRTRSGACVPGMTALVPGIVGDGQCAGARRL